MKYIIIGLGIFGSSLAEKLTEAGHEVIGVDKVMSKVELLKDKIAHTICLDASDSQAISNLPLKDTDIVVIAIGEDAGANIMATAVMKQYNVKRIISRAVTPLHQTVLKAMGITEIVHPEEETAERWAKKLNIKGIIDSFELTDDHYIVEAKLPQPFLDKPLEKIDFPKKYNVIVLNVVDEHDTKDNRGITKKIRKMQAMANSQTVIKENDLVILYGRMSDIQKVLQEQ
ncbi:MAG: TrkA family potassium uptake protein [Clostridia bacterium]|nr:TrkA family potassium uptake protein [Clostridia bacterium]